MTVDIAKHGSAVTDLTTDSQQKRRVRSGKTPVFKKVWTPEEDAELRRLVEEFGDQSWHRLCKLMPNKTEIRCFKRWNELKRMEEAEAEGQNAEPDSPAPAGGKSGVPQ